MHTQVFDCREKLHYHLQEFRLSDYFFTITRALDLDKLLADVATETSGYGKSSKAPKQSFKITSLKVYLTGGTSLKRPILKEVILTERLYEEIAKALRFSRTEFYQGDVENFCEYLLPFKTKLARFAKLVSE